MRVLAIEPATTADVATIAALVNAAYRGSDGLRTGWTGVAHLLAGPRITAALLRDWIVNDNGLLLVARQLGEVVGSVHLSLLRPTVGEISLLAIAPGAQSAGLGTRLLRAAEKTLREHMGCTRAELTVLAPRPELESWYARRGYAETGHRRALRPDGEGYGQPQQDALELVEFGRSLV